MQLGGAGAISRVALIKTASVSHSWNTEQRFIELTFQQNGDQLSIQAPTRAGDAPPGFYLLFVLEFGGHAVRLPRSRRSASPRTESGGHAEPRQSGQPVGTGRYGP